MGVATGSMQVWGTLGSSHPPSLPLGLRLSSLCLIVPETQSCTPPHPAGQLGFQILALLGDRGKPFTFWLQFPVHWGSC